MIVNAFSLALNRVDLLNSDLGGFNASSKALMRKNTPSSDWCYYK